MPLDFKISLGFLQMYTNTDYKPFNDESGVRWPFLIVGIIYDEPHPQLASSVANSFLVSVVTKLVLEQPGKPARETLCDYSHLSWMKRENEHDKKGRLDRMIDKL